MRLPYPIPYMFRIWGTGCLLELPFCHSVDILLQSYSVPFLIARSGVPSLQSLYHTNSQDNGRRLAQPAFFSLHGLALSEKGFLTLALWLSCPCYFLSEFGTLRLP